MNESSSSVMFSCDKCSAVIKSEPAFWSHLSTLHFDYYPYRCGYCAETGDIHSTATEDKMKSHQETIHCVKDLKLSIHRKHDTEAQLQIAIEKCRFKTENSPAGMTNALRHVYNTLNEGLESSTQLSDHRDAISSLPRQIECTTQASETTVADAIKIEIDTTPLPMLKLEEGFSVNELLQNDYNKLSDDTEVDKQSKNTNETRNGLSSNMESQEQPAMLATSHGGQAKLTSITVEDENSNEKKNASAVQAETKTLLSEKKQKTKRRKCPFADAKKRKKRRIGNKMCSKDEAANSVNAKDHIVNTDATTDPENAQEKSLETISEKQREIMEDGVKSNETEDIEEISIVNGATVKIDMEDDISTMSKDDTSYQAGEKPFKCTFCSYTTSRERSLKLHTGQDHIGRTLLKCQHCRYETIRADALTVHMSSHEKIKSEVMNVATKKKKLLNV
ncbi:hypothetical protein Ddc_24080 [Ditylenchus destructor]|nr:hypothetical protein Ddc_24080 [Ditylenchus destructor]